MADDNPFLAHSLGKGDKGTRGKADKAAGRAKELTETVDESWPRNKNGTPLMRVSFSSAELIPTGQYANVSVGPVQVTAFIDPERTVPEGQSYFTATERNTLAQATNELAEIAMQDVLGVQRSLVLLALQQQLEGTPAS